MQIQLNRSMKTLQTHALTAPRFGKYYSGQDIVDANQAAWREKQFDESDIDQQTTATIHGDRKRIVIRGFSSVMGGTVFYSFPEDGPEGSIQGEVQMRFVDGIPKPEK